MKTILHLPIALALALAGPLAAEPTYLDVRGSAFQLAVCDLDGDGSEQIIYATYDGWIRCVDAATATHEHWADLFDSFPTALLVTPEPATGPRVFVTDVDGRLTAYAADGQRAWQWSSPRPLQGVAGVRIGGGGYLLATGGLGPRLSLIDPRSGREVAACEVESFVQRIAAGDLDGDGTDEIVAADHRDILAVYEKRGDTWGLRSRAPIFLGDQHRNWESPAGTLKVFSLAVADLDGDDRAEIIAGDSYFNLQSVLVLNGDGSQRWLHNSRAGHDQKPEQFYSTAFVRPLPVTDRTGPDAPALAVVSGAQLRVFAADGRLLVDASARTGFSAIAAGDGTLYLGSSPNGDRTIYRVPLDATTADAVRSIGRRGLPDKIGKTLERIGKDVRAVRAQPDPDRPLHGWMVPVPDSGGGLAANHASLLDWLEKEHAHTPVRPYVQFAAMEDPMPRRSDGRPWNEARYNLDTNRGRRASPAATLIERARRYETARVPFSLYVGHSCTPFISLETAQRLVDAAPAYLRGFYTAEDEGLENVPEFITQYHAKLGAMLVAAPPGAVDRFNITKNKNVWWLANPARPEVFAGLTGEGRGALLVPATEDSNSRTPELNLFARHGLYQAGLVDRLFASYHEDLHSFNRTHQWEYPMHGHVILRLLVAHTLLGAREFAVRGSGNLQWTGGRPGFGERGEESTAIYLDLLARGLVYAPRPDEMANVLPVGFRMHTPTTAWMRDGFNGHAPHQPELDPSLEGAVLPRNASTWGMTRTPPHALTAVLFGKKRQFGTYVPATPHGIPVFVPAAAGISTLPGIDNWWETDGVALWRAGNETNRLTGTDAAHALAQSIAAHEGRRPFEASGDPVFMQVARRGPAAHRLWLIDPGWWDPADRVVTLHLHSSGVTSLRDAITGERLPVREGSTEVLVPAGAFRILDAIVE